MRLVFLCHVSNERRGGSRTAATSKMKHFVIVVNGFQPLTTITKLNTKLILKYHKVNIKIRNQLLQLILRHESRRIKNKVKSQK